ncbi:MAG: GIY-YIG nuclease family protein [Vulcanimicrobiaceae bacterium]
MKRYYVYMLLCHDGRFYIGVTGDLELRPAQHKHGLDEKCFTFSRRPLQLVWSSDFKNVDDALRCEKQLKGWSRAKKAALVRGDWTQIQRLSRTHPSTGSG